MNRLLTIQVFIIAMLSFYFTGAQTNVSPTIDETAEWLTSKLDVNKYKNVKPSDYFEEYELEHFEFNKETKTITYTAESHLKSTQRQEDTWNRFTYIIPVAKLDPYMVDTLFFKDAFTSIELTTTDTLNLIRRIWKVYNGTDVSEIEDSYINNARLFISYANSKSTIDNEKDLPKRIQKAFAHLITLCGGKKSTISFKNRMKKKEPF